MVENVRTVEVSDGVRFSVEVSDGGETTAYGGENVVVVASDQS